MIKTTILTFLTLCVMSLFVFSSCSEDWEPFTWNCDNQSPANVTVSRQTLPGETENLELQYNVMADANGGTVIFSCENYEDIYFEVSKGQKLHEYKTDDIMITAAGRNITITLSELTENMMPSGLIIIAHSKQNSKPVTYFQIGRQQ